jgi:magnesium transporter
MSGVHIDDIGNLSSQQGRGVTTGSSYNAASRGARSGARLVDLGDEDEEEEHQSVGDTEETGHLMSATAGTPHTMSRRNSMLHDDVCFPMLNTGEPNQSNNEDGIHRGDGHYEEQDHPHHHPGDPRPEGMPPGFPWTFDLNTLEEYARFEKIRVEDEASAAATSASNWGLRNRGASGVARDIKRRNPSDRRSMPGSYGASPDSDDATFYSRRPRKFVNVPGAEADQDGGKSGRSNSRYQRKLALFEGAGSSPPPIGARASTHAGILGGGALMEEDRERHRAKMAAQTPNGYPADTKTPLLDSGKGPVLPSYQGTNWPSSHPGEEPGLNRSQSVGADLSNLIKNKKSGRIGRGVRSSSYNTDRQYRFTFYSNALPNTIHARHLYEIPAPGQSFEELFMGLDAGGFKKEESPGGNTTPSADQLPSGNASQEKVSEKPRPVSGLTSVLNSSRVEGNTAPPTGANTPEMAAPGTTSALRSQSRLANAAAGVANGATARNPILGGVGPGMQASQAAIEKARAMPGGGIRMDQDPESCTWWLDVLCPTDQEMKMLSRVFGIHPLTTEDILMEETREKIELFRNYYLVCFRSFDQDPYSPTYLEPLNMYVIVFREGTLSFHFRATPHPQNVRRRIKQLKDYINVTSDWISYALIDDITDAFGPLIQSRV